MNIKKPYLLFLGDAPDELAAKTAVGTFDWRPDDCLGQFRLPGCVPDLGLPDLTLQQAQQQGVRTLLIGVANRGGIIPDNWLPVLVEALEAGLDLASGLHTRLATIPQLAECAKRCGQNLIDVRYSDDNWPVANGQPRSGHRILPVGTDCSVGKMYTALAIEKEMRQRGLKTNFRATGQTGIFIDGGGVPVDAVVADFIAGSVENLCPANDADHWDVVEGQGSLFHPSFAGVSLGLLHGAQPDVLILCHEPTRSHMRGLPDRSLPGLQKCMDFNLQAASVVSSKVEFAGISVNTKHLDEQTADKLLKSYEDEFGLPSADPVRNGMATIVDRILQ